MRWHLLLFRLRRYRRPALLLSIVVVLALGSGVAWARAAQQEFRLTVRVADPAFVASVQIHSACCLVAAAPISEESPVATFLLRRGDYTITATPSSDGYIQHWYFVPHGIRLQGDRQIQVHGGYG